MNMETSCISGVSSYNGMVQVHSHVSVTFLLRPTLHTADLSQPNWPVGLKLWIPKPCFKTERQIQLVAFRDYQVSSVSHSPEWFVTFTTLANQARSTRKISGYLGISQSTVIRHFHNRGCPRGVMVKAMHCGIVVREFVLQSRYYVHFRANTLGKGMNPLILPPAMGK